MFADTTTMATGVLSCVRVVSRGVLAVCAAMLVVVNVVSPATATLVEPEHQRLTVVGERSEQPVAASRQATFDIVANLEELTSDHATVFRLYWAFFLRQPDAEGALYWVERVDRCDSLALIADQFAASREFAVRYGAQSHSDFVELIYRNVLGRKGDPTGLGYWTGMLTRGALTRGEMVLYVSLSSEFISGHQYPSDGTPGRGCRLPGGAPTPRSVEILEQSEPVATVAGLTLMTPASVIEQIGFHQSTHPGALGMRPADHPSFPLATMASRNRNTDRRGAADIAVHPLVSIHSPVTGTVARAGEYTLYCRYRDGFVVINPDGRPDLEVKILHMQGVRVLKGDRVVAGQQIASRATPFPFRSQIDDLTAEPSWPHVHVEVVDPSIPRPPSSGSC